MKWMETEEELRRQIKCLENQNKRSMSRIVQLQQALARATAHEQDMPTHDPEKIEVYDTEYDLVRGSKVIQEAETLRQAATGCTICGLLKLPTCQEHHRMTKDKDYVKVPLKAWQQVVDLMKQQQQTIALLTNEQSKLCHELETRPARRQWNECRMQLECLRQQSKKTTAQAPQKEEEQEDQEDQEEESSSASLKDQIQNDRLLHHLVVKTKYVVGKISKHQQQSTRWRFIQLDSTKLSYVTVNGHVSNKEEMTKRIGVICAEMVAVCCQMLRISNVIELPQTIKKVQHQVEFASCFDDFLHKLKKTIGSTDSPANEEDDAQRPLESMLNQVADAMTELHVRRELMEPSTVRLYEIISQSMKLLQIARMDQLPTMITKLLEALCHRDQFIRDVYKAIGIKQSTKRSEVLQLLRLLCVSEPQQTNQTNQTKPTQRTKQAKVLTTTASKTIKLSSPSSSSSSSLHDASNFSNATQQEKDPLSL